MIPIAQSKSDYLIINTDNMDQELSYIIKDVRSFLEESKEINSIEDRKKILHYWSRQKYKTLRLQERLLTYIQIKGKSTKEITIYDFMIRLSHNTPC